MINMQIHFNSLTLKLFLKALSVFDCYRSAVHTFSTVKFSLGHLTFVLVKVPQYSALR